MQLQLYVDLLQFSLATLILYLKKQPFTVMCYTLQTGFYLLRTENSLILCSYQLVMETAHTDPDVRCRQEVTELIGENWVMRCPPLQHA